MGRRQWPLSGDRLHASSVHSLSCRYPCPDVHSVPTVLGGVLDGTLAGPVALGEGSVEKNEIRNVLAQRFHQARGPVGEQVGDGRDVDMGGADGCPEGGCQAGEGAMTTQVHERDERSLVRR